MARPEAPSAAPGFFISFEGGEGAGKSTQIRQLQGRLLASGRSAVATREPGGSPRAEGIRSILLSGQAKFLGSTGEAVLFAAARQDHVETLIRPALRRGAIVLCDRFVDSTRVYQGAVAGIEATILDGLEEAATLGATPDLTIVVDVPAAVGLERARLRREARGEAADRFEAEDVAYHERVRAAFLAIAAAEPDRCRVIDGGRPAQDVSAAIWSLVARSLADRAGQGDS